MAELDRFTEQAVSIRHEVVAENGDEWLGDAAAWAAIPLAQTPRGGAENADRGVMDGGEKPMSGQPEQPPFAQPAKK